MVENLHLVLLENFERDICLEKLKEEVRWVGVLEVLVVWVCALERPVEHRLVLPTRLRLHRALHHRRCSFQSIFQKNERQLSKIISLK